MHNSAGFTRCSQSDAECQMLALGNRSEWGFFGKQHVKFKTMFWQTCLTWLRWSLFWVPSSRWIRLDESVVAHLSVCQNTSAWRDGQNLVWRTFSSVSGCTEPSTTDSVALLHSEHCIDIWKDRQREQCKQTSMDPAVGWSQPKPYPARPLWGGNIAGPLPLQHDCPPDVVVVRMLRRCYGRLTARLLIHAAKHWKSLMWPVCCRVWNQVWVKCSRWSVLCGMIHGRWNKRENKC